MINTEKKIFFITFVLLCIFTASYFMFGTIKKIDSSINIYKQKAVQSKILVLSIEKSLNYISRCSRDIMLGNDYKSNISKINSSIISIQKDFELLETTSLSNFQKEIISKARNMTSAFIYGVQLEMATLDNVSNSDKRSAYIEYKQNLTPLAVQSRKYFKELIKMKDFNFKQLEDDLDKEIEEQKRFIIFISIIIAIIALITVSIIFRTIQKRLHIQNILSQYKNAIDSASIVSKTDSKGIITYVNDKFCDISQYSRDELIGKAHSIVRHADTPKGMFEDMWKTIKSKKIWYGTIQNKKKDGSGYFVSTTIVPIFDSEENIVEYISIRSDVSELVELTLELKHSQEEILNRIGMIAEARSKETGNHVKRVAKYSEIIAKALKLSDEKIELLYNASALHDIGKVGVPDAILLKEGKLTSGEYEIMKSHTYHGYDMLKDSKSDIVKTGAIIALQHHERYDGKGYPSGLKGDDISIFARITSLADVFDALSEERSYKKAWSDEDIFKYIKSEKDKHFDPKVVDAFFQQLDEISLVRKQLAD